MFRNILFIIIFKYTVVAKSDVQPFQGKCMNLPFIQISFKMCLMQIF